MAHSYHHAVSSTRHFGGEVEDYIEIHEWFDSTKSAWADTRHRAILHNTFGIYLCQQVFGETIKNSEGKEIPVRLIAEQHVHEDCGCIPTLENWLTDLPMKPFMNRAQPVRHLTGE